MNKINDGGQAFPQFVNTGRVTVAEDGGITLDKELTGGMTKREYFAGLALGGLAATEGDTAHKYAVWLADALLAELAKGGDA